MLPLSLQPTVVVTLETRKPAPASPRIPKNARILNSFMSFLRKNQKLLAFVEGAMGPNPNANLKHCLEIFSWPYRVPRLY